MPEDNGNTPSLNFPPFEQFQKSYDVFEEIGNGQFAVVKRCAHKHTGAEYAAKFIRKRKLANSRRGAKRADIEREVMVLREVSGHPNVISLYEVYESPTDVVLILELVAGGELFHHVYAKEFLCEQEALTTVRQILIGLVHLHSRHIAHLDLKPENVMLQSKCSNQVKLIDFGLSRKILPGAKIKDMIGTPEFVAPEIVNYDCLSMATDVWALGVITYILLSGLSPFMGETRDLTFCNITAVNYTFDEDHFASVSDVAKDFIRKTFVREPSRRATCEQLLRHPWLETVLLECLPSANNILCSSAALGFCSSSKSCDDFHSQSAISASKLVSNSKSVPSDSSTIFGLNFFTVCARPKFWLASPTAAVFVGSCSVLGCLCLAFYTKHLDGYICT